MANDLPNTKTGLLRNIAGGGDDLPNTEIGLLREIAKNVAGGGSSDIEWATEADYSAGTEQKAVDTKMLKEKIDGVSGTSDEALLKTDKATVSEVKAGTNDTKYITPKSFVESRATLADVESYKKNLFIDAFILARFNRSMMASMTDYANKNKTRWVNSKLLNDVIENLDLNRPEVESDFTVANPTKAELITAFKLLEGFDATFWQKSSDFYVYKDAAKDKMLLVKYRGTKENNETNTGFFFYEKLSLAN